jgi:hypothetical protein
MVMAVEMGLQKQVRWHDGGSMTPVNFFAFIGSLMTAFIYLC